MAGSFLTQLPDGALGIGTAVLAAFLTSAELPHILAMGADEAPPEAHPIRRGISHPAARHRRAVADCPIKAHQRHLSAADSGFFSAAH